MLVGRHDATVTLGTYTLNLPNNITNIDNSFIAALCDGNLRITQEENSSSITFYPNPTSSKIYIDIKNSGSISGIELYNFIVCRKGQVVRHDLPAKINHIPIIIN